MVSQLWGCSVAGLCSLPPGSWNTRCVLCRQGVRPPETGRGLLAPAAPGHCAVRLPSTPPALPRWTLSLALFTSPPLGQARDPSLDQPRRPLGSSPEWCGGGLGMAPPCTPQFLPSSPSVPHMFQAPMGAGPRGWASAPRTPHHGAWEFAGDSSPGSSGFFRHFLRWAFSCTLTWGVSQGSHHPSEGSRGSRGRN